MAVSETLVREILKNRPRNREDLALLKRKLAEKHKILCPSNIELLKTYRKMLKVGKIQGSFQIENALRTRPVRSLSGIVNISLLTKPYPCPGKCLYCPIEKGIPKSYLSGEPAVERAKQLKYNPYLQVKKRVKMLENEGHPTDKIELRVVGGTWSYYPRKYQTWFLRRCFDACNGVKKPTLRAAQKTNETTKHRVIGLSIETRPDFIDEEEIKLLREYGATMIELGVQSIYDDVLKLNQRGHGVGETIRATKLLKDAGFKILYQMMPNLPGSSTVRDLKMFKELFSDQRFKPDLLKIYPCALIKQSRLYEWWKTGRYRPYSEKQLVGLIRSIKKIIPYYVRIQRITRDIPSHSIVSGPAKISNLRQLVSGDCKCIRCREVKGDYDFKEKLYLFRQNYRASDGKEIFLSFCAKGASASGGENLPGRLYSLLRLRITSDNKAIIRELHTYGQLQPIDPGSTSGNSPQHKGLGKKLMAEAEIIVRKEFGLKKITAISGVGVRGYYKKLGYSPEDTYMVKAI